MAELTPIRLPWNYWIYQVLSILGFVLSFCWHILLVQHGLRDPPITILLLSLPMITCIVIFYSTMKLKQGEISTLLKNGWKDRRPVKNIHRFIIGWILLSSSISIFFGPYIDEFSWFYWLGYVVIILGFWLSTSSM